MNLRGCEKCAKEAKVFIGELEIHEYCKDIASDIDDFQVGTLFAIAKYQKELEEVCNTQFQVDYDDILDKLSVLNEDCRVLKNASLKQWGKLKKVAIPYMKTIDIIGEDDGLPKRRKLTRGPSSSCSSGSIRPALRSSGSKDF